VSEEDEVLAITSAGTVMRTPAAEVRRTGRDTMGVRLVNLTDETVVVSIARNAEAEGSESSEVAE
jgi:DNA gyrase subunit A